MKSFITLTLLILFLQSFGQVRVRSYYRKDGTYVQGHYRSNPDGNPYNNWSFPGNTNPYTGKIATGNPSIYLDNYYNRSSYSYSSSNYSLPTFSNSTYTTSSYSSTYTTPTYSTSTYTLPSYSTSNYTSINYPTTYSSLNSSSKSSSSYTYSQASSTGNNSSTYSSSLNTSSYSNNNVKSNINKAFLVTSEKAYFHNEPSLATVRNAYLVKGDKGIIVDQRDNFCFVIFTNSKGQKTSGWVDINMLTLPSETNNNLFTASSFEVVVSKAYFYAEPSYSTRKKSYLIYGEILYGQKLENGFIYTVFKNTAGVVTTGWINTSDVNRKP